MILAHHAIFSMYGFWLPNDPRGSGSDYVARWELFRYGRATKTSSKRSVAHLPRQPRWQAAAKSVLQHKPVEIAGEQALAIVEGFKRACAESEYRIYACAVLPDHVHLVIAAHARRIRQIVGHLKSRATKQLRDAELWDERPLWGEHGWNVRLSSLLAVERAVAYVERNPEKEGKKRQRWKFIAPLDAAEVLDRARSAALRAACAPRIGGAALRSAQLRARRETS